MTTPTREEVARRIAETAVLHGTFTLRSGRVSNYYVDKYLFSTQPDILAALGAMLAERVPPGTTRLAGAELGGIPLVTTASMASGLPCVFIRNARKDYGTGKQLEGRLDAGDRVVIVEDVATTGGQALEAAGIVRAAGAEPTRVVTVIDRGEGARRAVEDAGLEFEAIFGVADLGIVPANPAAAD